MVRNTVGRLLYIAIGGLLGFAFLLAGFEPTVFKPHTAAALVLGEVTVSTPLLSYQGRLLDPTTGQPKPDGVYTISFRLYNAASGGTPLWSELKDLTVGGGRFGTLLGDTTALDPTIFNGQDLWIAVKVGTDAEATPRQRIAHTAYAIFALAAQNASHAASADAATNADTVDGKHAEAFAPVSHTHAGEEITSGTVDAAHIDPAIARKNDVMPIVTSNGGAGSGLDADRLDGLDSKVFYKGDIGTQVSGSLVAGGSTTWTTWGYSSDELIVWWARPTTQGGKVSLSVETLLEGCCGAGQGLITYFLHVTNTGSVTTNYDLVRYRMRQ